MLLHHGLLICSYVTLASRTGKDSNGKCRVCFMSFSFTVNFFGSSNIPDAENLELQTYRKPAEILIYKQPPPTELKANYVLGENPMKMSYLVGYGTQYPKYIHHRGSSIPVNATTGCRDGFKWLDSTNPNPNVAFGALVGGPFFNETYNDFRNNSMQAEPTTYNSVLFVALLSGLVATSSVPGSF